MTSTVRKKTAFYFQTEVPSPYLQNLRNVELGKLFNRKLIPDTDKMFCNQRLKCEIYVNN